MKVRELIAILNAKGLPDQEIVMSSDAEGNSFHLADGFSIEKTEDMKVEGARVDTNKEECIVLWPEH